MLIRSCYAPDAAPRRLYVRFGCFTERIDEFDSAAFRLSYTEAAAMDPQCRILLEQTAVRTAQHNRGHRHVSSEPLEPAGAFRCAACIA